MVFPDGDQTKLVTFYQWVVDEDYVETFQMKLVEGRNLSNEYGTDSLSVVVNQAALKQFGWETAKGHFIQLYLDDEGNTADYKVVGVLEDFHFESLKDPINPMLMSLGNLMGLSNTGFYLTLRYDAQNTEKVIRLLEDKWAEFVPNYPFEYSFISDRFNSMYDQENRMGEIMKIFTILAIIIASLGLFGLTAFIAEKRTKEIGIRKVNGASFMNIFMLFTKDIAKLIIIAFILAVPLTWYVMDNWLNNFTYRIQINWIVFIGAGIMAFILAIITISYQAIKASSQNPVDSLKYE